MLGEKIKELRLSFSLSQVELGNKIGVSKQCISNWENENIVPSIEMLIKLANTFNVSTDYLLELNKSDYVCLDGLTDLEKAHVKLIVEDLLKK